jgi:hypothetical protein
MKKNLLFAFCMISILKSLTAQVPMAMPPDANAFYDNSMPLLRQPIKEIVFQISKVIKLHKANADSLSQTLRSNVKLKGISNNDIEGITALILVQAYIDADEDLKHLVLGICHSNERKSENQSTMHSVSTNNIDNKKGAGDDINEMQNLKLQMIMECKSSIAEQASYVMKKISGRQESIVNNLK